MVQQGHGAINNSVIVTLSVKSVTVRGLRCEVGRPMFRGLATMGRHHRVSIVEKLLLREIGYGAWPTGSAGWGGWVGVGTISCTHSLWVMISSRRLAALWGWGGGTF